jgi:hypothetical protein
VAWIARKSGQSQNRIRKHRQACLGGNPLLHLAQEIEKKLVKQQEKKDREATQAQEAS